MRLTSRTAHAFLFVSCSVLALSASSAAMAACAPGAPGVMDCTGDPGAQAFSNPPIGQLNYFNLTNNIVAAGVSGAQLTSIQPKASNGTDFALVGGDGSNGSAGLAVTINMAGPGSGFVVDVANGVGINAQSIGGAGGDGGLGIGGLVVPGLGGDGGRGGNGGTVVVTTTGSGLVRTAGDNLHAILALSRGGQGGEGGDGETVLGVFGDGGDGGNGGAPGNVTVNNVLDLDTSGNGAAGIWAQSVGAGGGSGGTAAGSLINAGGNGASASSGGTVIVSHTGNITTRGNNALGIMAQSVGGYSGSGGGAWGLLSFGGSPASAGNGGTVTVDTFAPGRIQTSGTGSYAVFAQSVGGGGGAGGAGGGLIGFGGDGGAAGGGSTVTVRNRADLATTGNGATALVAQSVGGGGGGAGTGVGVVGIGGSSGGGGNGGLVGVENSGAITIAGNGDGAAFGNYGILAQSVGGGGGSANASGGIVGIGGRGGAGGTSSDVTVTNSGAIVSSCGDCRDAGAIYAQSVGGGGGHGGLSLGVFSVGGAGGGGGTSGAVTVNNSGTLETHGFLSRGIFAQSIGGGGGDGGFAGGIVSIGGGGGEGGSVANPLRIGGRGADIRANQVGQGVSVNNTGNITTTGGESHAIFAQSIGGGGGNGGGSVAVGAFLAIGIGGSGGVGGNGGVVNVNAAGIPAPSIINTSGDRSAGIFAQSVGGGGGSGGFAIAAQGGIYGGLSAAFGGDGAAGGSSENVTVNANGAITTRGAFAPGIYAESIGGGGGRGGFSVAAGVTVTGVQASLAFGGAGGAGGSGHDVSVNNAAAITTGEFGRDSAESHAIFASSIGGGGGSGGFSIAAGLGQYGSVNASFGGNAGSGNEGGVVNVTNTGALVTRGLQSHGILAQSIGGGGGSGGFSGALSIDLGGVGSAALAFGGDGGLGGAAHAVTVNNTANVTTFADGSSGILAQSIGGGGGNGGFAGAIGFTTSGLAGTFASSVGGTAGAGSLGRDVTVTHHGILVTQGNNATGILAQSVGGGGGTGGFSLAAGIGIQARAQSRTVGGEGGQGGAAGNVRVGTINDRLSGAIVTSGALSHGILAQSIGGGGGNGGFAIGASFSLQDEAKGNAVGGAGGTGQDAGTVEVYSNADILTGAGCAIDGAGCLEVGSHGIFAQSIGGGGGNGGFGIAAGISIEGKAAASSTGGSGSGAGIGRAVTVNSGGRIETRGANSYGIFAQSVGGGGGSGAFSIAGSVSINDEAQSQTVGGSGGSGGDGGTVSVTTSNEILTRGRISHGILAQSIGGGGGVGGFAIGAGFSLEGDQASNSTGGSGAGAGNGGVVTVDAGGRIETHGDNSHGVFAQSVGGGGGSGAFSIAGSVSANAAAQAQSVGGAGGAAGEGNTVTVTVDSDIVTLGAISHGVFAQSVGGGGGDGGFSVGASLGSESSTSSVGGSGSGGGLARTVRVDVGDPGNTGVVISTAGDGSIGVLAQSIGGGGGSGGFSGGLSLALDGTAENKVGSADQDNGGGNITAGLGGNGGEVQVANHGIIFTTGNNAAGVLAQSVGGGGGNGSFSIGLGISGGGAAANNAVGGSAAGGGSGAHVGVENHGLILTTGMMSHGIIAQSIGGGGGNGGFAIAGSLGTGSGGATSGVGGAGGAGGNGGEVVVNNTGTIIATGLNSFGVFAQSVGGGGGSGGFAGGLAVGGNVDNIVGGAGARGGNGGDVTVTSTGDIQTSGDNSSAVFAQSVAGSGGWGGLSIGLGTGGGSTGLTLGLGATGNILDALPVAGTRGVVTVTINGETTVTDGALSYGLLSQAIGGGGGAAGNVLRGLLSMAGSDVVITVGSNGSMNGDGTFNTSSYANNTTTTGIGSIGLIAQSIGGGGGVNNTVIDALALNPNGLDEFDIKVGGFKGGVGLDGGGSGGGFDLTASGTVETTNVNAIGIVGQSIGGGGGVGNLTIGTLSNSAAIYNLTLGGSQTPVGNAGPASTLTAQQAVTTSGVLSHGIVGQSIGGGGGISNLVIGSAASIPGGINVALGSGGAGGGGNGGDITVNAAAVQTSGAGAFGIVGQSVGGGGGLAGFSVNGVVFGQSGFNPPVQLTAGTGAGGSGGLVTINANGDVHTSGYGAHGIVGQSVGGGGGIVGAGRFSPTLGSAAFAGTRGGAGTGGDVGINTFRNVVANASDTYGIYGGSAGTGANGRIVVDVRNSGNGVGLVWGGAGQGAGVMLDGGSNNVLASDGTIYANGSAAPPPGLAQISGMAVRGTTGNDAVLNVAYVPPPAPPEPQGFGSDYGVAFTTSSGVDPVTGLPVFNIGTRTSNIIGNIDLGAGQNSITNHEGALIISEAFIRLDDDATPNAGQTLINHGLLSPGDRARVQETAVAGNFTQTLEAGVDVRPPRYFIDIDLNAQNTANPVNDRLDLTGSATASGDGSLLLTSINKKFTEYTIIDAPSAGATIDNTGFTPTIEPGVVGFIFNTRVDPSAAGEALVLYADKPALSDLLMDPASGVTDPNVYRMADGIDAIDNAIGVDDPFNYLVNLLRLSPDVKTLGDAVASLTPSNAPHVFEIMHRRGTAFLEASAECPFGYRGTGAAGRRNCVWARGSYGEYDRDSVLGSPLNADSWHALTMGGQAALDRNWQIGFGLEQSMTDSEQKRNGAQLSTLDSDYYQGSLTATYTNGPFRMGFVSSLGRGSFESKRQVNINGFSQSYTSFSGIAGETPVFTGGATDFEGISGTATSKGDITGFGQLLRFSFVQPLGSGFDVAPFVDLEGHVLRTHKRTETGAGLANLYYPSTTDGTFSVTPGVELGYIGRLDEDVSARLFVRTGVRLAPFDRVWTAQTQFVAAPAGLPNIKIKDRFDDAVLTIDAGMKLFNSSGFELDVNYSGEFGDTTRQNEIRGGATFRF